MIADGEFRAFWARSREEEQRAFEQLVDFLGERLAHYPDLHVYHYAHYEVGVLRRLAGEYGTREEEVDGFSAARSSSTSTASSRSRCGSRTRATA